VIKIAGKIYPWHQRTAQEGFSKECSLDFWTKLYEFPAKTSVETPISRSIIRMQFSVSGESPIANEAHPFIIHNCVCELTIILGI